MREYEAIPRPTIEDHFHIRELIEIQEKRAADRTYHKDRQKAQEERMSDIKAEPSKATKHFYCTDCSKDFVAEAIKEVEVDWSNTAQYIAFYRSKCFCGKWAQRLITDKFRDEYWFKSKKVAQDRGTHHNDLVQSFETNYQLLYGKR